MSELRIDRTYDKELILSILTLPEIWEAIAEDGATEGELTLDVMGECWVLITLDLAPVALYNFHAHNGVTVEIHAHVLPEYRREYSRQTGVLALQWVLADTEYTKFIAQVPILYPNVKKFIESFGFVEEGVNRLSYKKNGNIFDQWRFGATRNEIEEVLKWEK